jgi:hypothetical protein
MMDETPDLETEPSQGLTLRHQRLLAALVSNPDIQAACKAVGVGRSTAHRWLKDPAFRAELARQRDSLLSDTMDSVKTHATRAMAELVNLLDTEDDRLRRLICNDILGHALKIRELEDIERRLTALEQTIKHNGRIDEHEDTELAHEEN